MYMLNWIQRYIKLKLKEPSITQLKDTINKDTINKDYINKYTIDKDTIHENNVNAEINDLYECYLCQRDGYLMWGTCDVCGSYNSH